MPGGIRRLCALDADTHSAASSSQSVRVVLANRTLARLSWVRRRAQTRRTLSPAPALLPHPRTRVQSRVSRRGPGTQQPPYAFPAPGGGAPSPVLRVPTPQIGLNRWRPAASPPPSRRFSVGYLGLSLPPGCACGVGMRSPDAPRYAGLTTSNVEHERRDSDHAHADREPTYRSIRTQRLPPTLRATASRSHTTYSDETRSARGLPHHAYRRDSVEGGSPAQAAHQTDPAPSARPISVICHHPTSVRNAFRPLRRSRGIQSLLA